MMRERGLTVDHVTIFRWVQRYAPEINRRMRPYLKMSGASYRIDETYVKVGTEWKYLYRAVDSAGDTIEFMLSAKRDVFAAKWFFTAVFIRMRPEAIKHLQPSPAADSGCDTIWKSHASEYRYRKLMRADHRRLPFTIGTDKHASYPEAFTASVKEKILPHDCKLRRVKYLNNVIEQDHRFIRRRWRAMQCFRSFHTAERTLEGIEAVNMMRKGQVNRLAGSDARGQAKFVASLFQIAA
jgi:transposase-like protein